MPNVSEVRPKMWDQVEDLYDDGTFSAIWGNREVSNHRELGIRWNGGDGYAGYPNQGGNPLWFSVPNFLSRPILLTLLDKVNMYPQSIQKDLFIENILRALRECGEIGGHQID